MSNFFIKKSIYNKKMFMKNRKEEILGMHMKYPEMSYSQIAKELKISKSLVAFYCNEKK